ncbi:hypothetical protein BH23ACT5_BH23ACT5_16180 [soil metagenome]
MDLYARVNILDGRAVRLPRGEVHDAIALDNDPVGRVANWFEQGADYVHVVDLDAAAFGDDKNRPLIDRIIDDSSGPVQIAGGIRSHVEAARLLNRGAWRILMGTAAIEDQNMVWDLCREYPDRIAVSLDVRPDEQVATRGWTKNSGRYLEEVLIEMSSAGAAAFLVAAAGRDVLAEPANMAILSAALATVEEPVVASGGAQDLADLERLISLSVAERRLGGVVVGREVTAGRFTLQQAKEMITAGPKQDAASAAAAAATAMSAQRPDDSAATAVAAAFMRAADASSRASDLARAAARNFQETETEAALAAVEAARAQLAEANELLRTQADSSS